MEKAAEDDIPSMFQQRFDRSPRGDELKEKSVAVGEEVVEPKLDSSGERKRPQVLSTSFSAVELQKALADLHEYTSTADSNSPIRPRKGVSPLRVRLADYDDL